MHRFYYQNLDLTQDIITITDPTEIHHIKNVLRLKANTEVKLFADNNLAVKARIIKVDTDSITAKKIENLEPETSNIQIALACAIPKKGKFELIIEKTTELGISEIFPMITKRTEVSITGTRVENKQQRFLKVAQNAAKQSNRNSVPAIHPFTSMEECIAALKSENYTLLIPSLEEESTNLKTACEKILPAQKIAILIGPEGDFTKEEYILAKENECIPVTLGPTILKVETAAISAIAYLRQQTI